MVRFLSWCLRQRFAAPLALVGLLALAAAAPLAGRAEEGAGVPAPAGAVIAIGGGRLRDAVLVRFIELARARPGGGPVIVCPAASARAEGDEADMLRALGARDVRVVDLRERRDAEGVERASLLESASGVFFTGGDQRRLLETVVGTAAHAALRRALERGAVVLGTSAGAAALGSFAITGDGDSADTIRAGGTPLVPGLGLVPGVIFDQHFLARRRHNRLVSALLDHPGIAGIGIDEGAAALFGASGRGPVEVLGEGLVSVYARAKEPRTFMLQLLGPGDRLEIPEAHR